MKIVMYKNNDSSKHNNIRMEDINDEYIQKI